MGDTNNGGSRPTAVNGTERVELAAVLSSSTFARAQRLVKLLEYICDRHFEGRESQICEYSIATEVLGRPANFDPAEDAIARVEIHRLRKKLREYYAAEGSQRPLKIIIPPGLYTPVFQQDGSPSPDRGNANGHGAAELAVNSPIEPNTEPLPVLPEAQKQSDVIDNKTDTRIWLRSVIFVLAAAALVVLVVRTGTGHSTMLPKPASAISAIPSPDSAVRVIAGYDRKYIDHHGHLWLPDRYFEGGGQPKAPYRQFIARTSDPLLYQNGRIGIGSYNIPLKPGIYELKLHFVEPVYGPGLETGGGENSRVFDILINGREVLDGFDIVADAGGPLIADIRVFKDIGPAPDGLLHIGFHARREQPIVSAIEVEPAQPHLLNPVRVVTQPNSVTDSHGQVWEPDNYYLGGQASNHWKAVSGTDDADLFGNERYGHFSYAIPVAPGVYEATFYFAETYWGKENQGGGGSGQRIFDVNCNGAAIVRGLDILKEVGPNHGLIKRFRGLRPNAQGKLDFDFVPVVNYASVFAIEVVDQGR